MFNINLAIYVFSYNRPEHLRNCVKSLLDHSSISNIFIVDDNSDDENVINYLNNLPSKVDMIDISLDTEINKVGGLYRNMNLAIEHAKENDFEFVMFVQDDMQLVRDITDYDISLIKDYFRKYEYVQYYPVFYKYSSIENIRLRRLASCKTVYFKDINYSYSGFSGVGIFNVDRFCRHFNGFDSKERSIDEQARSMKILKGEAVYPFLMYLPFPIAYRGKRKTLGHKLSELITRCGFYPFKTMNSSELSRLIDRDPIKLPYAEEYLSLKCGRKGPWSYSGGVSTLYELGGIYKLIAKVLKRI